MAWAACGMRHASKWLASALAFYLPCQSVKIQMNIMRKMISASSTFHASSISHVCVVCMCVFFLIVIPLGALAFNVLSACNIIILEQSTFLVFYSIWPLALVRGRVCVGLCMCLLVRQCQVRLMPRHTLGQLTIVWTTL